MSGRLRGKRLYSLYCTLFVLNSAEQFSWYWEAEKTDAYIVTQIKRFGTVLKIWFFLQIRKEYYEQKRNTRAYY